MGRAYNDDRGWKRGLGAYSAADCGLMSHGKDDGNKSPHSIADKAGVSFKTDWDLVNPQLDKNWKLGPVSSGGPPRYAPKGDATTRQVSAASPSGKYGKKGGSGQRSGA